MEYDSSKGFIKRTLWGSSGTPAGDTTTFTTGATTAFIRFGSNMDGQTMTYAKISAITWMLTEGSTAESYEPYITPQTASVVNLFSVDNYKDEVEIISGGVKRKVGITILTGEETGWALSDSGTIHRFRCTKPSDCHTPASRAPIMSSHFVYNATGQGLGGAFIGASTYWYWIPTDQTIDTVEKWIAWLKAQYAQGTPVFVLYPLKEETTESVTPQTLSTSNGDNIVTANANVSPINLSVTFKKVA